MCFFQPQVFITSLLGFGFTFWAHLHNLLSLYKPWVNPTTELDLKGFVLQFTFCIFRRPTVRCSFRSLIADLSLSLSVRQAGCLQWKPGLSRNCICYSWPETIGGDGDFHLLGIRILEVLRLHFFVDLDPEPESHPKEPELESCGSGSKVDPDPHPDPDPFLDLDLPQM